MNTIVIVVLLFSMAHQKAQKPPEPMWNGTVLSMCPECSGWTMDQLVCGFDDPAKIKAAGSTWSTTPTGTQVTGWHVEEDPTRTEYRLHAGGYVPSGIPVPVCVPDYSERADTPSEGQR